MKGKWILLTLTLLALMACTADHEAMRQRLKYVSDCNRADTVFTERWLPTVDSLVAYFDPSSRSWLERFFSLPFREGKGVGSNDRMMAHYVRGRVYHDMGEAPQALECYQKAAEQADTTRSDCDLYTLYAVYGQISELYHSQFLAEEEMKAIQMAEKIAWKDRDTLTALYSYELRKKPYYLRNDTDSILYIESSARDLYRQIGNDSMAARTERVVISILIDREQYEEAGLLMMSFEGKSEFFDSLHNIRKGYELYYYDKGRYLLSRGNADSASYYFQKTLNAGNAEAAYKGMLALFQKKNIADSISKYSQLYASANNSSFKNVNQARLHQISAMYDYSRQQYLAEQNAIKAKSNAMAALVFFIIALFSMFAVALSVHSVLRKNKERKNMEEKIEDSNKEIEKLTKEIVLLRQLKHQSEYNGIQTTIDNLTVILSEKEKRISSLQSRISYYKKKLNPKLLLNTANNLEDNKIYTVFRGYLKDVTHHPSKKEWQDLYYYIDTVLPSFKQILMRECTLTEREYNICCLVRMGFSPSEISVITETPNVSVIRKRLHKKILKFSGTPKDFDVFLFGIK